MKILMIAPQPFFEPRGTPISVFQRLHGLSELGYQVDLVTYHVGGDVDIPGVNIKRAPRIPFINKIKIGPSLAKFPLDIVLFFYAFWTLLRNKYDVMHTHEEAGFFALILAPLFRIPHLYDMHSSLPKQLENYNFGNYKPFVWAFETLENWVLKSSKVVLTIGTDLEDHVLKLNPKANHIRIENIAVHGNTKIDPGTLQKLKQEHGLEGKKVLVYTGTFERYQGFDLLFESIKEVVAQRPNVHVLMVGGKPEQVTDWKNKVSSMGLSSYVTFTGLVSLEESVNFLQLADILLSPRTVGLSVPLKIYSYLQSGKPTVATNILAHTQIMDDQSAMLVDPDANSYAQGLLKLLEDNNLAQRIGGNALELAQKEYSKEAYLKKLSVAYTSIEQKRPINELLEQNIENAPSALAVQP